MKEKQRLFFDILAEYRPDVDKYSSFINETMTSIPMCKKKYQAKSKARTLIYSQILMIDLLDFYDMDASKIHGSLKSNIDNFFIRKLITNQELLKMPLERNPTSFITEKETRILEKIARKRDTTYRLHANQLRDKISEGIKPYHIKTVEVNDGLDNVSMLVLEDRETRNNTARLYKGLRIKFPY
jgi:hypothetical protein